MPPIYDAIETNKTNHYRIRNVAFILSILLIFILPWRALFTLLPGFTAARLIGFCAGIVWIVYLSLSGEVRRLDTFHIVLFSFVFWSAASMLWTIDYAATMVYLVSLSFGALFCVIFWDLFRDIEDISTAAFAYVAGCFVLIFLEGYEFLLLDGFRIGDFISGPNYVVGRLILGLPLAWYLAYGDTTNNKFRTYIGSLYLPIASITILFTRSRQGFVALVIVLSLIFFSHIYVKKGVNITIVGSITTVLAVVSASSYLLSQQLQRALPVDRILEAFAVFSGDVEVEDSDLSVRVEIYQAGIDIFLSNPIIGTGAGSFPSASESILNTARTPHNTYLSIATELGLVGLIIFAVLMLTLIKGSVNSHTEQVATGHMLLITYLILSTTNTWFTDFTALFILTFILLTFRTNEKKQLYE